MRLLCTVKELNPRSKRKQKTLALIQGRRITTQQELMLLLQQAGFPATQSIVSRDLEELGVVKRRGFYVLPQTANGASARGLVSLLPAGDFMLVARCEPGLASAVAVEIDRAKLVEIAGTIAGEDTIFIALHNAKLQRKATKRIWGLFG
jgi:transcriptional regulator of arginine metabolism